jgi:hypothetical protein
MECWCTSPAEYHQEDASVTYHFAIERKLGYIVKASIWWGGCSNGELQ